MMERNAEQRIADLEEALADAHREAASMAACADGMQGVARDFERERDAWHVRAEQWKEAARLYRRRSCGIYSNLMALCAIYPDLINAAKRYGQAWKAQRLAVARKHAYVYCLLTRERRQAEIDLLKAAMRGWGPD